jgi:hypothetical protein
MFLTFIILPCIHSSEGSIEGQALIPLVIKIINSCPTTVQRCKHFEIGGDKKGKGTTLF